jgi:hypothetical protein
LTGTVTRLTDIAERVNAMRRTLDGNDGQGVLALGDILSEAPNDWLADFVTVDELLWLLALVTQLHDALAYRSSLRLPVADVPDDTTQAARNAARRAAAPLSDVLRDWRYKAGVEDGRRMERGVDLGGSPETEQGDGDVREPDESPLSEETRRELSKRGLTLPGWTPTRGSHPTDSPGGDTAASVPISSTAALASSQEDGSPAEDEAISAKVVERVSLYTALVCKQAERMKEGS